MEIETEEKWISVWRDYILNDLEITNHVEDRLLIQVVWIRFQQYFNTNYIDQERLPSDYIDSGIRNIIVKEIIDIYSGQTFVQDNDYLLIGIKWKPTERRRIHDMMEDEWRKYVIDVSQNHVSHMKKIKNKLTSYIELQNEINQRHGKRIITLIIAIVFLYIVSLILFVILAR